MKNHSIELPVATGDGIFLAHYSENGLAGLDFPRFRSGGRAGSPPGVKAAADSGRLTGNLRRWHRVTVAALKNVLAGRAAKSLPPLDWAGKTEFQRAVWREMLKLAPGKTKSYGEVAAAIGRPKAVRAVGGACGANPIPVLVPCHRILAANGKIGGFSGGLEWKRGLLEREGVAL